MARITKYFANRFLLHTFTIILFSYIITRTPPNAVVRMKITRLVPDMKHVLIWSSLSGVQFGGQKHFISKKCNNINCYFTKNRTLFGDVRYFDAIIFNLQDVSQGSQDLPDVRNKYQKYIFAANESADNFPVCDPIYDGFFNWTWTYRYDSTIPYRFIAVHNLNNQPLEGNHFQWEETKYLQEGIKKELGSKYKTAAIFLDKCKSRSKREVFLKNLQKHLRKYNMTIDIFGKCGSMECRKKTMKPCLWKVKKYYYFYLALEDSFATDYVTKTVLYAYDNNAVPIVYGNAAYSRLLPPDSYIDGRELGEEKLALTMYQTAFDPNRYLQFFKWKRYYTVKESPVLDACALCSSLNNANWLTHEAIYKDFRQWWNRDYVRRCEEASMYKMTKYFAL